MNQEEQDMLEQAKKTCPNDCVVVRVKDNQPQFRIRTWHGKPGEIKTMPVDVYQAGKDRVEKLWEPPHLQLPQPEPEVYAAHTAAVPKSTK